MHENLGPFPLPRLPHCLTSPCQGQGKAQSQEPHGDRGVQGPAGGELGAGEPLKALISPRAPPLPCWHPDAGQGPAPAVRGPDTSSHAGAEDRPGE